MTDIKEKAKKCLCKMDLDEYLFDDGRRNNDAVNLCLLCCILDRNPWIEYQNIWGHHTKWAFDCEHGIECDVKMPYTQAMTIADFSKAKEHMERVIPWANKLYDNGRTSVYAILDKALMDSAYMEDLR